MNWNNNHEKETQSIGGIPIEEIRGPRGYRIILWPDGYYHVYCGEKLVCEVVGQKNAIVAAYQHRNRRKDVFTSST